MATFGQAWNQAWLDVPGVDPLQMRQWCQDAYKQICHARLWSWRLKRASFQLLASVNLTDVGVTLGSTTITSTAVFTGAMVGRQFRVGTYPVYTILTFTDASSVELDRPYEGATIAAAAGEVLSAFVTAPADLDSIQIVVDLVNQVRIGHWYTQEQLSLLDPMRTNRGAGPTRGLFGLQLSAAGLLQWEAWPYSTSPAALPYNYATVPADLADSTPLPGLLLHRPDVLALAGKVQGALFPGTEQKKNPYYSVERADVLSKDLAGKVLQLTIRDDDQYPQNLDTIPWSVFPLANLGHTADYLRATDASVDSLAYY